MAHYVQIPKDLNDIKQKFIFGLTKRQVISFGIGGLIGIPVFFLTKSVFGLSGGIIAMGCCCAPAVICGIYKKNGLFFEQFMRYVFRYYQKPRKRIYRPVNVYESIERQIEYNKLRKKLIQAEGGKSLEKRDRE